MGSEVFPISRHKIFPSSSYRILFFHVVEPAPQVLDVDHDLLASAETVERFPLRLQSSRLLFLFYDLALHLCVLSTILTVLAALLLYIYIYINLPQKKEIKMQI